MAKRICQLPECDRKHYGHGYCEMHWDRIRKHGTPYPKSPTVADRFWAKVEKTETCWLWTACKNPGGYGKFHVRGLTPSLLDAHRAVFYVLNGSLPPSDLEVDHLCHVRHCVNPDHLRLVTRKQNAENRSGARRGSQSGVRGVYWHKQNRKWVARARAAGKTYHGGCFDTIEEAEAAAIALRNRLFTHNDLDRTA